MLLIYVFVSSRVRSSSKDRRWCMVFFDGWLDDLDCVVFCFKLGLRERVVDMCDE